MKKSFTRILSVIMVLSMIFVLLPSMVSAANTNYGIIYLKVGEKYDLGSYIPNGVKIISWQESSPYIRLKDSVVYADSIGQATVTALASNYDTHTFTISVITNWNGYCPICGIYNCVQHMNPGFGNYYDHWCTICGNYWCNDINHYYSWTNDINWIYGWNHYCSICQNYYCTNANHMSYWTINNNWNNGWWHWCTKCESYNCANPDHMNNWIYIEGESNPHYCSICENYNCTNLKHSRYWSYYDGSYISSNYLSDLFFNGKHVYKFTRVYNGMRYLTIDEILKINPATDKYTFSIDGNNVYYGTLNDYVKNHEICKLCGKCIDCGLCETGGYHTITPPNPSKPSDSDKQESSISDLVIANKDTVVYKDIVGDSWYYNPVKFVKENKLIDPKSEDYFNPADPFTRAQLVVALARYAKVDLSGYTTVYSDVESGTETAKAFAWAVKEGIVSATDDKVSPNEVLTNETASEILFNFANYKDFNTEGRLDTAKYEDKADIDNLDAVQWALYTKILSSGGTKVNPDKELTRANGSYMLYIFDKNVG